ncbi:MAG TPA: hypothetical protein VN737_21685 [Bryobacteraceae bacterium]|nr:hypothetical protein [Bryobacteraceae bacterium]
MWSRCAGLNHRGRRREDILCVIVYHAFRKARRNVSDALVRKRADAMVSSGLKAAGYQYVNVGDCWDRET